MYINDIYIYVYIYIYMVVHGSRLRSGSWFQEPDSYASRGDEHKVAMVLPTWVKSQPQRDSI